jgi:hypothetical protein
MIAGGISPPCGRVCTGSLMIICGDAQQRPSDASQIPLSSPYFGRLPVCSLPDHRAISEVCPALSSVVASRRRLAAVPPHWSDAASSPDVPPAHPATPRSSTFTGAWRSRPALRSSTTFCARSAGGRRRSPAAMPRPYRWFIRLARYGRDLRSRQGAGGSLTGMAEACTDREVCIDVT